MITHPQICDEECIFFEEKKDDAQKEYLYCKKAKCNIHYSWRMMSAINGCASHSSTSSERKTVPAVDYERANEVRKRTGNVPIQKQSCRFQEIFDYGHYIVVVCEKSHWSGTCEHQTDCLNDQYTKYCRYALGNSIYPAESYQSKAGDLG
jgi:hypothetical protein